MTAYAIARLRHVRLGEEIASYLQKIDATLAPHGGHFLIHGGVPAVKEGRWDGDLIVIGFPSVGDAERWYASESYQAILPLRTRNSEGDTIIVQGVDRDHRAADLLAPLGLA